MPFTFGGPLNIWFPVGAQREEKKENKKEGRREGKRKKRERKEEKERGRAGWREGGRKRGKQPESKVLPVILKRKRHRSTSLQTSQ